nr:MAG TPA: protein of unknown function (DUF3797) [Caudoviricetes sp.]
MSEKPKCPGCGADMELVNLCNAAFCYVCKCGWDSPVGIDPESARRMAMRRAEPNNRVLTLEEVDAHCEGGADAAPLWVEFDGGINRWVLIAPVRETCKMDFVSKYLAMMGILYEKEWRCWLRKPTKEEMEATPWES